MGLFQSTSSLLSGLFFAVACSSGSTLGPSDQSEVKIVNGKKDTDNSFQNVVLLTVRETRTVSATTVEICTGVITAHDTVWAAAHCIKNLPGKNAANLKDEDLYTGVQAHFVNSSAETSNASRPIYARRGFAYRQPLDKYKINEEHVGQDIVVLKFAPGSFTMPQERYAKLIDPAKANELTPRSTKVYLVGYGATQFGVSSGRFDVTARNFGTNVISGKSNRGYFTVSGSKSDIGSALANRGDSGGPLFLEDKVTLIGIGSALKEEGDVVTNYFTDLSTLRAQNLKKLSEGKMNFDDFKNAANDTIVSPAGEPIILDAMCGLFKGGKGKGAPVGDGNKGVAPGAPRPPSAPQAAATQTPIAINSI